MNHSNYDALKLKNQFCFPIYAASREVIKQYRPFLDELGLTYTQYIAMMVFWEDRKLNVKELGQRLLLDSGTLTPVLKNLEAKGYVRRYRSTEDERVLLVEVTPKGDELRDRAVAIPLELTRHVNLTHDECLQLHMLLNKVLDGLAEK